MVCRFLVVIVIVFMTFVNKTDVESSRVRAADRVVSRSSLVDHQVDDGWRHTASGWQRWNDGQWDTSECKPVERQPVAHLHPLLLATLQLLTTLFALVWFSGRTKPREKQVDFTVRRSRISRHACNGERGHRKMGRGQTLYAASHCRLAASPDRMEERSDIGQAT